MFRFLKAQYAQFQKRALKAAKMDGREICGLIINNGHLFELIEVENRVKGGGGFQFHPPEIRRAVKACRTLGFELVGTFHSHPSYIAKPSPSDIENAVVGSLMLIFDVVGKTAALWRINEDHAVRVRMSLT